MALNFFSQAQGGKPNNILQPGALKKDDQQSVEMVEESAGSKVVNMNPGDYLVHVHVQSAKNLVIEGEDSVDPFIKIEILNLEKQTTSKNGITPSTQVKFDEHIFLQFNSLTKEQLQDAKICLSVLNKGFFKGDVIGSFNMTLSKVYNKKDHVMMHQLIGLNNPNSKDFGKITGYIIVSINVQGPGDEATELKLGTELDVKKNKPMVPASIKKQYKQLTLRIYKGENLPLTDSHLIQASTIDAYVQLKYQGCKLKTKIINNCDGKLAEWNQEMLVPIEVPLKDDKIHLKLYDYNDLLPDELCSSIELSIPYMLKVEKEADGTTTKPTLKWLNMYGSRVGSTGETATKMNEDSRIASSWKGRILVEYFVEDTKYPLSKIYNIKDSAQIQKASNILKKSKYFVIGEFGRGLCLPDKKPYKLKINIGKKSWISDAPKQQKNNYCRWDQRFKDEFEENYEQIKRFPFVFIYLLDGDKEVCFYKTSILQFIDQKGPIHWQQFEVDKSIGFVNDEAFSGIFSFRLYINDQQQSPFDFTKVDPWKTPMPTRMKSYKVRISIYQCECLPAADSNGSSDPYLEVWTPEDQQIKTKECFDTNNPIFYEVKDFSLDFQKDFQIDQKKKEIVMDLQNLETAQPIILNLWDVDKGIIQDTYEFIGRAIIFLPQIQTISSNDEIPYPAWYPIRRRMDDAYNEDTGISPAVLCSFQLINFESLFQVPAEKIKLYDPQMMLNKIPYPKPDLGIKEFKCEITVLGLRNLVSTGLLPVNKAFVKFNLKSMLPTEQASAVENIQTQPFENGSNPNIRTTLQFELKMPSDPTFAPRMTCDVFDLLFFETLPQPHIGTFTLKIGDIMFETIESEKEDISKLQKALKNLDEILLKVQQAQKDKQNIKVQDFVNDLNQRSQVSINSIGQDKSKSSIKVGHKILQHMSKKGFEIPSSTAIKGGLQLGDQKKDFNSGTGSQIIGSVLDDGEQLQAVLGSNMRKKVQLAFEANLAKTKEELQQARKDDQKKFSKQKDAYKNIVMPTYKFDERLKIEREMEVPPQSLFKDVGYDPTPKSGIKQYRRYFPNELENIKNDRTGEYLIKSPFIIEKIYRAKQQKAPGLIDAFFGNNQSQEMAVYEVGQFKGHIRVLNEQDFQLDRQQQIDLVFQILEKVKTIYDSQYDDQKFNFNSNILDNKLQMDENEIDKQLKILKKALGRSGLDKLYLYPILSDLIFEKLQLQMLNTQTKCKVRLYVIEGFNFAKRDIFSESDPYLVLKCGKTEFNERQNYQLDNANPTFYKSYDFMVDFPGAPMVEIIAYDYDELFGDELIGKTTIDLDDRYFSQEWWAVDDKPIEYRDLFDHSSTVTQGVVKVWCEINQKDTEEANKPPMDISPAPSQELELRLVIWKTRDIEGRDHDQMCDPYIKAFLDDGKDQSTDVHWRCQTGCGSFNYRLVFPLKSLQPSYQLTIQCWDKDIISSDELIGECMLDLSCLVEDTTLTGRQMVMHQQYFDEYLKDQLKQKGSKIADDIKFDSSNNTKFWLPIRLLRMPQEIYVSMGEVQCSLQIVTKNIQQKCPQGIGRAEPNNDPICPEPEGRLKLTVNPLEMIQQFISPDLLRKIMIGLAISVCTLLCLMMLPQIIANLITKLLVG